MWASSEDMRAAHLVSHHFGYAQVGCLFGEPKNGYDHVWSVRNGLHFQRAVNEAFDKEKIIILPYDESIDGQRFRLNVVDLKFIERTLENHAQLGTRFRWLRRQDQDEDTHTSII